MSETELERLVAERVRAKRDLVAVPPDFADRIIHAMDGGSSVPASGNKTSGVENAGRTMPRRSATRDLLLAAAVFVFVALLAGSAVWLRSLSQVARHPSPAPTVSALYIRNIHMMTTKVGWAFKEVGGPTQYWVLRTTDGGNHWIDTTGPLRGCSCGLDPIVFFLDPNHAWYTDGFQYQNSHLIVIRSTGDGGKTWHLSKPLSFAPGGPVSLHFVDPLHGWLVSSWDETGGQWGGGALYDTADGGTTWRRIETTPSNGLGGTPVAGSLPANCSKTAVIFTGRDTGWASAWCLRQDPTATPTASASGNVLSEYPALYRTDDAGKTWTAVSLPVPAGFPPNWLDTCACVVSSLAFHDQADGAMVMVPLATVKAIMYVTNDGGSTWRTLPLPSPSPEPGSYGPPFLQFVSGTVGWYFDGSRPKGSRLFQTRNGGITWEEVYAPSDVYLRVALDFVDVSHGWAVFDGTHLVRTSDSGHTWSPIGN